MVSRPLNLGRGGIVFNKKAKSATFAKLKNKMMKVLLFLGVTLLLLTGCGEQPAPGAEKTVQEIKSEGPIRNADIVRNPISAKSLEDTVNVAKMTFAELKYDFGEVDEGAVVTHVFEFVNDGKQPLIIQDARSTCGCTVPDWPKEPIVPGEGGAISVRFNTEDKKEKQVKPITITANTYPAVTRIYLTGYVHPRPGQDQ